jgi:hypothetical protein
MEARATKTKRETKRVIIDTEETITLEISVKQAHILRTILGKNNGSTTSDIYLALNNVLGKNYDEMERKLQRGLPSLGIYNILGE